MFIDDFDVNYHLIKREEILVGVPRLHMQVTPLCSAAFFRAVKKENYKIQRLGYLKSNYYTQKPRRYAPFLHTCSD